MYELPQFKSVYVYHSITVTRGVSKILTGLFCFTRFETVLPWTKNERKDKRFLFLNPLTLFNDHHSPILTNIVKKTIECTLNIEYFSQIKHIAHARFCHLTLSRRVFFYLGLALKVLFISESCIVKKLELNFYFHTSLWCLKRFFILSGIEALSINVCVSWK